MEKVIECERSRLREIAEQENTTVYEYSYDSPQHEEADAVQTMKCARMILEERHKHKNLNDEDARNEILRGSALISKFSTDHPKIFEMISELHTGSQHYQMLQRMAVFKRQSQELRIPPAEATAQVSAFIMEQCKRSPVTDEEKPNYEEMSPTTIHP